MYEDNHHPEMYAPEAPVAAEPQVIWMAHADEGTPAREADPYDVINFLLKKVEEQQSRLTEIDGYVELQTQEIEQLRGQVEVTRKELDTQIADYEVLLQNTLGVERELEAFKQKAGERPKISLPFHTEQKLAKLGYTEDVVTERQAV